MKRFDKTNPFKTPEDYFEDFMDKMKDKLSARESSLPKKDGFLVPDGYFEDLDKKILENANQGKSKVIQLRSYRNFYFAAASVAAIAIVIIGLNWSTSSQSITFDDLANSDIVSYFESNEWELSTYEIAEVIPVDELEINDILEEQLKEESIIDYLDQNIDEFEELNLSHDEY